MLIYCNNATVIYGLRVTAGAADGSDDVEVSTILIVNFILYRILNDFIL